MVRRRGAGLLALAAALVLAGSAPAAQEPEGWSYSLWREIMSPFCPGRTLSDCPSPQADTLRMWILVQEAGGRTRSDVQAELVERYGESILQAPRARGFGLTAYAIPLAAFALGGVLVALFLRRQAREARESELAAPLPEALDPELERAIDEELAR